jgi:hypothetical protein
MLHDAIREKLNLVVDLDDPTFWAKTLQDCAIYFQKFMPMVLENLVIAQHRDSLQYVHLRNGAHQP